MTNASQFDNVEEVLEDVSNYTVPFVNATMVDGGLGIAEKITVVVLGALGGAGMCLNIAILVITYQERLIKKDYRMLYYSFITLGDLMFSTHAFQVSMNTLFRNFYVFRLTYVCMLFQIVLGVIAYQWSAMCIIFLLADLIWSIKRPFCSTGPKRCFSQIICIVMFFIGVTMAFAPFMIWDDVPHELEFCSLANVYGVRWNVYQHQAIIMISSLVVTMLAVSFVLLWNIYKIQLPYPKSETQTEDVGEQEPRTHNVERRKADVSLPSQVQSMTFGTDSSDLNKDISTISGEHNTAFVSEEDGISRTPRKSQTFKKQVGRGTSIGTDCFGTQRELRRQKFIRASRTVAVFMLAYLGTCTPVIILHGLGIGCGSSCKTETVESQVLRALMSTGVFCLPIIDPILYTQRFVVFQQALNAFVNKVRCGGCRR